MLVEFRAGAVASACTIYSREHAEAVSVALRYLVLGTCHSKILGSKMENGKVLGYGVGITSQGAVKLGHSCRSGVQPG